mgnify:FL=1
MATTKQQVQKVCEEMGDVLANLLCFYQPEDGGHYGWTSPAPAIIQCSGTELPERTFDAGYGGTNGEPVICFSDRYVYIKVQYDGSEWIEAIPRHPEFVKDSIPWPGG